MKEFPEKDWKVLRKLEDKLLQRFCNNALDKIKPVIENRGNDSHEAYSSLWEIMHREDKELATMFDDLKRSTAFFKLAAWKRNGLLSDTEFSEFSNETKDFVKTMLSI